MPMLHEPVFWVAAAFAMFVLLAYKKAAAFLMSALDSRSAKIKEELGHARSLRMEAEQVLAEYRKKQEEYLKEAELMLKKAEADAVSLSAAAEKDMKAALDMRLKNALERIAQEEEKAIQDVRDHVVDIALAAARAIIIDQASGASQDDLVKLALADIERKIH